MKLEIKLFIYFAFLSIYTFYNLLISILEKYQNFSTKYLHY